jgi:hypothetical protein
MTDRRLDFYIRDLYEMLKLFSLDQFIELYNRTFRRERPLNLKDFTSNLSEQQEKTEFINSISSFEIEKEEIKRIFNVANQILTRKD